MKNILLTFILIILTISSLNAEGMKKTYERLSDKLSKAEKEMYKAYKVTGKSLNTVEKRAFRSQQYTWKLNKANICNKQGLSEKAQLSCTYKEVKSRTRFIKEYSPTKTIINTLSDTNKKTILEEVALKQTENIG